MNDKIKIELTLGELKNICFSLNYLITKYSDMLELEIIHAKLYDILKTETDIRKLINK